MFLKKEHIRKLREGVEGLDRWMFFVQGLVDEDGNLTEAGRLIADVEAGEIDSSVVKIAELYTMTGYIPEEWRKELQSKEVPLSSLETIYRAYTLARPPLVLTPELVSFMNSHPVLGYFDDIAAFEPVNILNMAQATRLLHVSPLTGGRRSYVMGVRAIRLRETVLSYTRHVVITEEKLRMLEEGEEEESLVHYGLQERGGKITEMGRAVLAAMKEELEYISPVEVTEDMYRALSLISEGEEVEKGMYDLLYYLGLVDEEGVTDIGKKVLSVGPAKVRGVRALLYSERGDVPSPLWLMEAEREGLVRGGVTFKGEVYTELSKVVPRTVFLRGEDVAVLLSLPYEGYITREELLERLTEKGHTYDGLSETLGLVRVLQNEMIGLTERGKILKEVVENANAVELMGMKEAMTPLRFRIVKEVYEREEELTKLWKKAEENRKDYYEELAEYLSHIVREDVDRVMKELKVLHITGFLGNKDVTEAGRKLATSIHQEGW